MTPPSFAQLPAMSVEDAIAKFNVAFGTTLNQNQERTKADLMNLSRHAHEGGENYLASVLYRYAEAAKEVL